MSIRKELMVILASLLLASCSATGRLRPYPGLESAPEWVQDMVSELEKEPVANPPASLLRYDYHGDVVYFRPQQCCDIPSVLYDTHGEVICYPDGGITGRGDGRCPDFGESRANGILIWRDPR